MDRIAGIDLGTTNSEIAIVKDGVPRIINLNNSKMMPSCVSMDENNILLVGHPAKNRMLIAPDDTILSIKRKMGQNVTVPLKDRELTPEEISSFILRELMSHANTHLEEKITRAVITVPAYFGDDQRKATVNAGKLADIDVVRIINEPTAAALAYDYTNENDRKILVYDFGGGTFDASVVVIENGVVEVQSSQGDTHLGGDDIDDLLINFIVTEFKAKHSIDLLDDTGSRNRLWKAAEAAKRVLSDAPFAHIREEFISGDLHLDLEISRDDFERMITPVIEKTISCVHTALKEAQYLPGAIDTIILAGGSTRIPLVSKMIDRELGKTPVQIVDPDTIVALGAAVQAEVISGGKPHSVLIDITPHSFGTSAIGDMEDNFHFDKFFPIIKKNTPIPVEKSEVFYTYVDNQEAVDVKVFEGEQPVASDNKLIGSFLIENLSRKPAGNPLIMKLNLDNSGILKVTAEEKVTGLAKTVTMHTRGTGGSPGMTASKMKIADILQEHGTDTGIVDAGHDEKQTKNKNIVTAKQLRKRAEKLINTLDGTDRNEIEDLLGQIRTAINEKDMATLAELNGSLSDMLFFLED